MKRPVLHLCVVWLSEQTVTFALHVMNRLGFINEVKSVDFAVHTESLYNTDTPRSSRVKHDS
jgi:hypothetical protein